MRGRGRAAAPASSPGSSPGSSSPCWPTPRPAPITGDHWGHVNSSPPITAHLGEGMLRGHVEQGGAGGRGPGVNPHPQEQIQHLYANNCKYFSESRNIFRTPFSGRRMLACLTRPSPRTSPGTRIGATWLQFSSGLLL